MSGEICIKHVLKSFQPTLSKYEGISEKSK